MSVWERIKRTRVMGAIWNWLQPCHNPNHIRHQLDVAIDSHRELSDKLVDELHRGKSAVARNLQIANEALSITDAVRRGEEK
jgi:hypothetical protein